MQNLGTPSGPRAKGVGRDRAPDPVIVAMKDLVQHARATDLPLADEILSDVLAKLCGRSAEKFNWLR